MKYKILYFFTILTPLLVMGQHEILIDASKTKAKIASTMYGIFFEDINFAADGGIYAELIKNRSFEFDEPKLGWTEPQTYQYGFNRQSGESQILRYNQLRPNKRFIRVQVSDDTNYSLVNEGFRGIGIKTKATYDFSISASNARGISAIVISLIDGDKELASERLEISPNSDWNTYETALVAYAEAQKAQLKLEFEGSGEIDLDMISLFPQNTYKGRKKGLRKDIVEWLEGMNPGFLRFPGGCIVEGRTLEKRYQWKKTIGTIDMRESLINRWNTEFNHRPTPDYFQSFGLGFFEYFQLAEDLGAEPMPILGCGMACQFNTAELAPLDELDEYIQDALDLIEFANADETTYWGNLRTQMGHPKPFDMKYIGIGNEQWGPEYIKRFTLFEKVIKEKYPEIIIVSGSGPFPDGDFFDYGWSELKKLNAEIVDEHFYQTPNWFRENADRYDNYDRNGPQVFAGEYAAQSVGTTNPENKNNWECALSEAAFMTGLERNADIVRMSSYAPLLAHVDAWQWKTDLIWFDNLTSFGTPSYYVQTMYGNNAGTDLLNLLIDGNQAVGQNEVYGSAVKDIKNNELILKLVNTSDESKSFSLNLNGVSIHTVMERIDLQSDELDDENSIEHPMKIAPKTSSHPFNVNSDQLKMAPYSFSVVRFKISS